jgi:hypothetical protein
MVYQAARAVMIPVIGLGGIACGEDAAEFLIAGASAGNWQRSCGTRISRAPPTWSAR